MLKNLSCLFLLIFVVLNKTTNLIPKYQNTCRRFQDYFFMYTSSNCYYNPDVYSSVPEILARHVKIYENHTVITDDGYILTIFRIPRKNPKGVIILQHPLTSDSIAYITQNEQSLAFLLWKKGYDIWLPNNRGTKFSKRHLRLTPSEFEYWDFSFHEIGIYDYPSVISYIKKLTNSSNIIFFGYSMGSTSALIYSSMMPDHAKDNIKLFILAGTPTYLQNVKGSIHIVMQFASLMRSTFSYFKIGSSFRENSLEANFTRLGVIFPFKKFIVYIICYTFGWTPEEFDPELFNLAVAYYPREFSWKHFYHYEQIIRSGGVFRRYDYGKEKNYQLYYSSSPPEYLIENITVPIYLITSTSDYLATVEDNDILYDKLSPKAKIYGKLQVSGISHVDYLLGKSRFTKVYNHVFNLIKKII